MTNTTTPVQTTKSSKPLSSNQKLLQLIRKHYQTDDFIPLHAPVFSGNEKKYLMDCIDSTFVSSVGKYVDNFEIETAKYLGAKHAVATVNGTSALHIALKLVGVTQETEVITQAVTFVATCNAVKYCGANPVFIDCNKDTMGLCPNSLKDFFEHSTEKNNNGKLINKKTKKVISACVPMHTLGIPCEIDTIVRICADHGVPVVEDAAESLGSQYKNQHLGTFGSVSAISFNGNIIITTGGGGMIVTNDAALAKKAKHLTTTAKLPHPWEFDHDEIGYNYRMPNINAAIGLAQLEKIDDILNSKKEWAKKINEFCDQHNIKHITTEKNQSPNYWINAILCENRDARDKFLKETNDAGIMTRPLWKLMHTLDAFKDCEHTDLSVAEYLVDRIVCVPSSLKEKTNGI